MTDKENNAQVPQSPATGSINDSSAAQQLGQAPTSPAANPTPTPPVDSVAPLIDLSDEVIKGTDSNR